jgi:hypothetical protein
VVSAGRGADATPVMVSEGDECYLDLGAGTTLAAKIIGFHGADVALMIDEPGPELTAHLSQVTKAHLLLWADPEKRPQAGSIIYSGSGSMMLFRTSDGAYNGLKRTHSRAPLRLVALVAPISNDGFGSGRMFKTHTLDLSAGGVRIPRTEHPILERCRMMMTLPDQTKVSVLALLNRTGDADLAYRFTMLSPQDRSRISTFVLSWHMDFLGAAKRAPVGAR